MRRFFQAATSVKLLPASARIREIQCDVPEIESRSPTVKRLNCLLILLLILLLSAMPVLAVQAIADDHPDRVVQPDVPQGKITSGQFTESQIFPGTKRDYSVYVPAQYKADQPASLMVFMDGIGLCEHRRCVSSPRRVRQSDSSEGDAGHDRRVCQSGHDCRDDARSAGSQQSVVRIRFDGRSSYEVSDRRIPARRAEGT